MAESPEHRFLSQEAVSFFERAAETRLFSLLESERKKFDITCTLMRDWSRPIVGQVLWRHVEGVDKDVRTMLSDPEAELCLYIAADTTKARSLWSECMRDFYKLVPAASIRRLRTVWVPADIDLDREDNRRLVQEIIANDLAADVLLNVVLGNLSSVSVAQFAGSTGSIGMDLAVLYVIATEGFTNVALLGDRLGRSSSALRERLTRLVGCGYLTLPSPRASYFHSSLRGRVFLELCREVHAAHLSHPEMRRVLRLLELVAGEDGVPTELGQAVTRRIDDGVDQYQVQLDNLTYHRYWESEAWPPMLDRPSGFHGS